MGATTGERGNSRKRADMVPGVGVHPRGRARCFACTLTRELLFWGCAATDLRAPAEIHAPPSNHVRVFPRVSARFRVRSLTIHRLPDRLTPFAIRVDTISRPTLVRPYKASITSA